MEMESILLVSSSVKVTALLTELLQAQYAAACQIVSATSGGEARRLLSQRDYDLILVNTPLQDELGHDVAITAAQHTCAGVMLLVKSEMEDEISGKVEDYGVMVVGKPISRQLFYQALKMLSVSHRRLAGLRHENLQLQNKIEEIRLVDRAKCVLIQYLNMTEPQAHRYIEKQAMDMRCTKVEVAQGILRTYES